MLSSTNSVLALSLNLILFTCLFKYLKILFRISFITLLTFLVITILVSYFTTDPFIFLNLIFFVILEYIFIRKRYNNWLIPSILLVIQYMLITLIWLITFDIPRFIKMQIYFNKDAIAFILLIIFQNLFLCILFYLFLFLNQRYHVLESLLYLRKKNFLLGISLFITLIIIMYTRIFNSNQKLSPNYILSTLFVFSLSFSIFLILFFLNSLYRNVELVNQQKILLKEFSVNNEEYSEFKHDLTSLLIALKSYIQTGNNQKALILLEQIYTQIPKYKYGPLTNINDEALRSIFMHFSYKLDSNNIHYDCTIFDYGLPIQMNLSDCIRCMSILLNNSFEASKEEKDAFIFFSYKNEKDAFIFSIKNRVTHQINLSTIFKRNYSTKKGHDGLGMFNLRKITSQYNNVSLDISFDDNFFEATIIVFT